MKTGVAVVILIVSIFLASKVLKVINRGTIGTTQGYIVRAFTVWVLIWFLLTRLTSQLWEDDEEKAAQKQESVIAGADGQTEADRNFTVEDYYGEGELQDGDEQADIEYIFPDSDSRYLEEDDLEGMDKELLRIARNEIVARHGRRFDSEDLQYYFDSLDWYDGIIEPEEFDESVLNKYEKANMKFIKKYE